MSVSLSTLAQFHLFEGMSQQELINLAQGATLISIRNGCELKSPQEGVGHLKLVLYGQLQVTEIAKDHRKLRISLISPGQIFGYELLTNSPTPSNTIIACEDSSLVLLPVNLIQDLCTGERPIALRIFNLFGQALWQAHQERTMLTLPNAFHRIFMQLNLLTNVDPSVIQTIPRQEDIARLVNTSRETVSRAIQMLVKCGVLTKVGHQIQVEQKERLHQLAIEGPAGLNSHIAAEPRADS